MATLGELVREWRTRSELSTRQLADMVGHNVKRQHIEQLEAVGSRQPRYLAQLAEAMGTTADQLLKGKMPPLLQERGGAAEVRQPQVEYRLSLTADAPPPAVAPGFKDPPRDTAWQVMQDLDDLHPDDRQTWIDELHRLAQKAREIGRMQAEKVLAPMKEKTRKT